MVRLLVSPAPREALALALLLGPTAMLELPHILPFYKPMASRTQCTKMILVVDDEPADLEIMRDALEQAGYTVITAANGKDALKIYQQYDGLIGLLLTDVAMAPIDGCELAKQLTELDKNLLVIFVSGYAGAQALRYRRPPVSDSPFLRKPFTSEQLLAKVREFMEPKRVRTASGQPSEY